MRDREREREREREAETQAEGEAGSMQGAQCGTPSWVSRITPWAEGGAKPLSHPGCPPIHFFLRFYLFIHERHRDREREAETQTEGEAGSNHRARCGTWSRASRITPWAEGGAKPLSHPGCPSQRFNTKISFFFFKRFFYLFIHRRQQNIYAQKHKRPHKTKATHTQKHEISRTQL